MSVVSRSTCTGGTDKAHYVEGLPRRCDELIRAAGCRVCHERGVWRMDTCDLELRTRLQRAETCAVLWFRTCTCSCYRFELAVLVDREPSLLSAHAARTENNLRCVIQMRGVEVCLELALSCVCAPLRARAGVASIGVIECRRIIASPFCSSSRWTLPRVGMGLHSCACGARMRQDARSYSAASKAM